MSFKFLNSKALLVIGLWFLVLANVWHWFAQRIAHLSEGLTDGLFGLFMGLAIGTLLLGVARRGKTDCSPGHI
jgi:uncharacterized membrane protein